MEKAIWRFVTYVAIFASTLFVVLSLSYYANRTNEVSPVCQYEVVQNAPYCDK